MVRMLNGQYLDALKFAASRNWRRRERLHHISKQGRQLQIVILSVFAVFEKRLTETDGQTNRRTKTLTELLFATKIHY